jgi:hypothetical protein
VFAQGGWVQEPASWHADMSVDARKVQEEELLLVGAL